MKILWREVSKEQTMKNINTFLNLTDEQHEKRYWRLPKSRNKVKMEESN